MIETPQNMFKVSVFYNNLSLFSHNGNVWLSFFFQFWSHCWKWSSSTTRDRQVGPKPRFYWPAATVNWWRSRIVILILWPNFTAAKLQSRSLPCYQGSYSLKGGLSLDKSCRGSYNERASQVRFIINLLNSVSQVLSGVCSGWMDYGHCSILFGDICEPL